MKFKETFSGLFVVFALLLVSVSALSINPQEAVMPISGSSTISFALENQEEFNQSVILSLSRSSFTSEGGIVSLSISPSNFEIASKESKPFSLILSGTSIDKFKIFSSYATTLMAIGTNSTGSVTNSTSQIIVQKTFCSRGAVGRNLSIRNVDINNLDGKDDEIWKPLNEIEVEVEVENVGTDDIDDVIVEMGLYDINGKNIVRDLDFSNAEEEEIDLGRIKDGDRETVTFTFKIPADIKEGAYKLAIKSYSDDIGEDKECVDFSSDFDKRTYQSIEIEREDDEGKYIAFTDININPTDLVCGDSVSLSFNVYNIGDEDQDRVKIFLKSKELNLDLSQEIRNGLDQGDSQLITFNFKIPADVQAKTYTLELNAAYDYRNGVYRQNLDNPELISLKVISCGIPSEGGITTGASKIFISASLEGDAKAGQPMVVSVKLRNAGATTTYIVDVSGYSSWATLESISDRLVTLDAGEEKEVKIKFVVDKKASGQKTFNIEAKTGNTVERREVSVNIEPSSGGISGFAVSGLSDNSSLIWIIGIINIILIILIIIVAIRISRR